MRSSALPSSVPRRALFDFASGAPGVAKYSRSASVHSVFSAQAQATPDAPAILDEEQRLTYRELDLDSNQLAKRLQSLGVKPGDFVGVLADRSAETIVALLAILKAGAAYAPFDPTYPQDLLDFMLDDCRPALVLTQRPLGLMETFGAGKFDNIRFVELENALATAAYESSCPLDVERNAGDVAYVMYTSGSTGRPKGVLIPHRGIVRLVREQTYANFGRDEVFLHMAPLAFDASTFEIWGALLNGGSIAIERAARPSLQQIGDTIRRFGVTTAWFTAGLFHLLVDYQLADLRQLRRILAGGDVLSPPHVEKALAALPETILVNGYGPTENTTFSCCYEIPRHGWGGGSLPIGLPIAHTEVLILGADFKPVADGEVGQLCVAGDGLALGYLNRPDLTQEKFIQRPFKRAPSERLYLTGDQARRRSDGLIEFLGRTDRQVKINGKRVELDEIENALRADRRLSDALVTRLQEPETTRLAAYLKPVRPVYPTGEDAFGAAILEALRTRLPEHMVPAAFVVMDSFPLTPNGKVDRRQLPAPRRAAASHADSSLTPDEDKLAEIWRQVLGVSEIGPDSNFFDLGGHSLLAMRLIARIAKTTGVKLGVAALFQAPTLRQFARLLSAVEPPKEDSCIVQIQPYGAKTPIIAIHNTLMYHKLAGRLGTDRPFIGIRLFNPDDPRPDPTASLEEIAADYVRLIRQARPHGPYVLLSLCVAGAIAYEAARQLREAGESTPVIIMADTWAPGYEQRLPPLNRFVAKAIYRAHVLRHRISLLVHRKASLAEVLSYFTLVRKCRILEFAAWLGVIDPSQTGKDDRETWLFLLALAAAESRYRASPSPADLVLLQSDEIITRFADPDMGWTSAGHGKILRKRIPGWHEDVFLGDGAALIADYLRPLLEQVDAEDAASAVGAPV
ncbi:amino acid adenylation domain-containing protein [Methylocapsa palsarum]|uniref:amino acid adenylation domain-containing protein n=1 Tax=Methylocapsa palsarum TaxID=1612308 RepID=UPI001587349C|nr:amino acid adenylation domain-containing protein [Methylocapsa palsarum]